MKEVIWILIWSVGWIPCFAFGLWMEERSRLKKARQRKRKQSFMSSVESAGQRLMREDRIRRILNEPVRVAKPIRKACGVFSSEEAQRILEV